MICLSPFTTIQSFSKKRSYWTNRKGRDLRSLYHSQMCKRQQQTAALDIQKTQFVMLIINIIRQACVIIPTNKLILNENQWTLNASTFIDRNYMAMVVFNEQQLSISLESVRMQILPHVVNVRRPVVAQTPNWTLIESSNCYELSTAIAAKGTTSLLLTVCVKSPKYAINLIVENLHETFKLDLISR